MDAYSVSFALEATMLNRRYLPLLVIAGMSAYVMLQPASAQQAKPIPKNETFVQRLARYSDVKEKDAERCIQNIGKALMEDLRQGRTDTIPGLGSFRIVRVAESKDLVNGRPATIPAYNVVEFSPEEGIAETANGENIEASVYVPSFKYILLPGQTPGQRIPSSRMPSSRMR
jgi:nucleoid DNA-binding protein